MYKDQKLAKKYDIKMNKYYNYLGRKRYNKVMAKRSQHILMPHLEKRISWGLLPPRKLML